MSWHYRANIVEDMLHSSKPLSLHPFSFKSNEEDVDQVLVVFYVSSTLDDKH